MFSSLKICKNTRKCPCLYTHKITVIKGILQSLVLRICQVKTSYWTPKVSTDSVHACIICHAWVFWSTSIKLEADSHNNKLMLWQVMTEGMHANVIHRRGSYPITSTALLSSGSSSREKVMGSHRLSLAMILTLSRPLLSRVYLRSWYRQSQSHRWTESRGRHGCICAYHMKTCTQAAH